MRNTCIAESIYLVMNSLLDWEPVGKLKQRRDTVSFTCFQYEASGTVLKATDVMDRGNRQLDQKVENCSSRGVTE